MSAHLADVFMESLFLVMWAISNVAGNRLVDSLHITGIDAIVLRFLQILFAVSTLAPICISMYMDIRIMIKRASREINAAGAVPIDVSVPIGDTPAGNGETS
jgi:hypothetical protein